MEDLKTTGTITQSLAEAIAEMDAACGEAAQGLPSLEGDWEFVLLGLKTDLVDQVQRALDSDGLSRADLARRMEVTRAHVSAILNEAGNFQLETIAKLAVALKRDVALRLIRESEKVAVEPAQLPANAYEHLKTFLDQKQVSRPWQYFDGFELAEPKAPTAAVVEMAEAA